MSNSWLSGKTCIVTGASGGMGAGGNTSSYYVL